MGLFMPLVIYTSARKRFGDWPNNPYNLSKINFLSEVRDSILPIYETIKDKGKDLVTFGAKKYSDDFEIFETDLMLKPKLTSNSIKSSCTLLIADPRDILRAKRDIERDHSSCDADEIEIILINELKSVETFLNGFTPFIFVPGFAHPPYRNPLEQYARDYVRLYRNFHDEVVIVENYTTFDELTLQETADDLMLLQDKSRAHLQSKLDAMKNALKGSSSKHP